MKKARILSLALIIVFAISFVPVATSALTPQEKVAQCQKENFFGLKPWYFYLGSSLDVAGGGCEVKCFNIFDQGSKANECGQTKSDLPLVLLAIIDTMLRLSALIAIGFVMYGAIQLIGSQGEADAVVKGRTTIINALIGLALAVTAVSIVAFIGNRLGG